MSHNQNDRIRQRQLLFTILGVIIFGIVIAISISLIANSDAQSSKDHMIQDLTVLAANARQFHNRPAEQGGGGGTYTANHGYVIPEGLASTDNGSYTCSVTKQAVAFIDTSARGYGTITAVCDSTGHLGNLTYAGEFQ